MNKVLIGMMAVLVFAAFVIGININNNSSIPTVDSIEYHSNVCADLKRADSNEWESLGCTENTVTTIGLSMVKSALGAGTATPITNLTLGNTTVPTAASTTLPGIYNDYGLAGITGAYNTNSPGSGNWSISYTWTCTSNDKAVNTTGLYNATNGLFAGTSFTTTVLQNLDQLKVNYTLWVS